MKVKSLLPRFTELLHNEVEAIQNKNVTTL